MPYRPLSERLFAKVDFERSQTFHDGVRCHEWTGVKLPNGYGQIHVRGVTELVHRASWNVQRAWDDRGGQIPDGLFVLHRCDNRCCVNLLHLFLGTFDANMADMVRKERQAHGEKNGHAKLTEEQARYVLHSPARYCELARQFDVAWATIWAIKTRKSWRLIR